MSNKDRPFVCDAFVGIVYVKKKIQNRIQIKRIGNEHVDVRLKLRLTLVSIDIPHNMTHNLTTKRAWLL